MELISPALRIEFREFCVSRLILRQIDDIFSLSGVQRVIDGYKIYLSGKGVESKVKNLIFAADGPKPEIVLSDSVSNDIEIVKNAEFCLVYNRPILEHGLLWKELIDWYCDIIVVELPERQRVYFFERRLAEILEE